MATTPFTSEWEWQNINRGLDYTVIDNANLKRNNWTLTRMRYSNDIYTSELDAKSTSLTAYNGGVPETIGSVTGSLITGAQFDTDTIYTLDETVWVETGYTRWGSPSYRMEDAAANIPDSSKTNILTKMTTGGSYPTETLCWAVIELDNDVADNNGWSSSWTATALTYPGVRSATFTRQISDPVGVDGQVLLASTSRLWSPAASNDSTVSIGSFPSSGTFLCTGDTQQYQQRGVDWYQQVQTWSFKDSWRTA